MRISRMELRVKDLNQPTKEEEEEACVIDGEFDNGGVIVNGIIDKRLSI